MTQEGDPTKKIEGLDVAETRLKHIDEAKRKKKIFIVKVTLVWIGIFVALFYVLYRFNLDFRFMLKYTPFIFKGVGITIFVSIGAIACACILALIGAVSRLSKNPVLYGASTFYVSLIRGTPLIVQIFVIYLGLPQLGIILSAIPAGIIALSVNYGAYMTEIFRGGIQAVRRGQMEAAYSLGMTYTQMMKRVVLPQALRIIIPATGNEFIAMLKDSSLVSVLAVRDVTHIAKLYAGGSFRFTEAYTILAVLYLSMTIFLSLLVKFIERKISTDGES